MRQATSLTRRLLAAQAAVVAVMTATVVLVALVLGPRAFDRHIHEAHAQGADVATHATEAFHAAGLTALGVGSLLAIVAAVWTGTILTRRIGRGLDALTTGAARVAAGHYDEPVRMPDTDRELLGVATALNDMAARVAATEQTRRRMLTDLSHEMRTPLAAIDVTLEAVEDGVRPADAATLAILREQTRRLARLATDIKDVSAAEEGRLGLDPRPTDLRDVLTGAVDAARASCEAAGVTLILIGEPGTATVDAARIGQILDNLLRNACRHTPPGGHVHVAAQRHEDAVEITVTDDGSGIAAADLEHVFERFYRADSGRRHDAGEGTGVGLSISRALAAAHGGTLTAASDGPGHGARFTLTLPV